MVQRVMMLKGLPSPALYNSRGRAHPMKTGRGICLVGCRVPYYERGKLDPTDSKNEMLFSLPQPGLTQGPGRVPGHALKGRIELTLRRLLVKLSSGFALINSLLVDAHLPLQRNALYLILAFRIVGNWGWQWNELIAQALPSNQIYPPSRPGLMARNLASSNAPMHRSEQEQGSPP